MESSKRNIYSFKLKDPDLRSLRDLVSQMHPVYRMNFGKNYGNLLSILNQQVDHTALITLAQFYELPLRCFTFQDFQLAPTLEDFERLVRIPMKNKPLFEGIDESLPLEVITSALHMEEKEAEANLETKGKTKGFPLSFLLERAHTLFKAERWDACYSAIALAIYDVVLFPNMDGFVDITAICVFRTGNPVPTLLVDVYYYISHRYTNKKGLIACCAPLLYQWFLEHLPKTAEVDQERQLKNIATEASRVSPMIWEENCREVRDARESVSYWKNQLESSRQDSSIWLKERDYVIEDYESFKKTIDFL
ncbi:uncharacterized protein LOC127137308 [Lathyrus oleraceus]|uniref:uncharacterized protein LOC127137308 n=1 Tax=Pisum sativum TaxID=3888 RepID=UPI0021D2C78A|nr:uncharacterized protein LOC127137308 [Pisum sativum]